MESLEARLLFHNVYFCVTTVHGWSNFYQNETDGGTITADVASISFVATDLHNTAKRGRRSNQYISGLDLARDEIRQGWMLWQMTEMYFCVVEF